LPCLTRTKGSGADSSVFSIFSEPRLVIPSRKEHTKKVSAKGVNNLPLSKLLNIYRS